MDGDEVGVLFVEAVCACGEKGFMLRLKRDEGVGLLTCAGGHHSLLLDSRDYWADVLGAGRPQASKCRCGSKLFTVLFEYELREGGEVRTVMTSPVCAACGRAQKAMTCDIKYSPTAELIARPLDPIDEPWKQPRRVQLTGFWLAEDVREVATHLVEHLSARLFIQPYGESMEERELRTVEFMPELRANLYFTTSAGTWGGAELKPHHKAPLLRLSGATHMAWDVNAFLDHSLMFLLHYVEYAVETVENGTIQRQPPEFLAFAAATSVWLQSRFVPGRGSWAIDNPEEKRRLAPFLQMRF